MELSAMKVDGIDRMADFAVFSFRTARLPGSVQVAAPRGVRDNHSSLHGRPVFTLLRNRHAIGAELPSGPIPRCASLAHFSRSGAAGQITFYEGPKFFAHCRAPRRTSCWSTGFDEVLAQVVCVWTNPSAAFDTIFDRFARRHLIAAAVFTLRHVHDTAYVDPRQALRRMR